MLNMLLLTFGVFCCSTAVIFIKAGNVDTVLLAVLRLLVAAVFLLPLFIRDLRQRPGVTAASCLRRSLIPGILLSVHFISWIAASRMTSAANATLIVNLVPLALPVMLFVLLRERLTSREVAGTIFGLVGMLLLSASDFQLNREHFLGDMLCLASMLFLSLYLAWARRHQGPHGLWLYVVPLYAVASLVSLILLLLTVAFGLSDPFRAYTLHDWLMVLGLGLVPTVLGHSILNISMKRIRGQVVSIVNMGQFVFATTMAFFLLGETPQWTFWPASILVVSGALTAVAPRPIRFLGGRLRRKSDLIRP